MGSKKIFSLYNQLWNKDELKTPLNIMIGGNIGTGKSTFAHLLTERLQHINVLPTGIIRSVLQSLNLQDQVPELYGYSYQLGQLVNEPELSESEKALIGFERQLVVVDRAIRKILEFSQIEGQQYIFDGNHVVANTIVDLRDAFNLVGVFFKTSNVEQYRKNISGPTHQRRLTPEQFKIVRTLHDHIVSEAIRCGFPVFEYNEQDKALRYVASQIAIIIERTHDLS